jgi:hypothetical protein
MDAELCMVDAQDMDIAPAIADDDASTSTSSLGETENASKYVTIKSIIYSSSSKILPATGTNLYGLRNLGRKFLNLFYTRRQGLK